MKSKKVLAAVLTAALMATTVLAGCGAKPTPNETPAATDKKDADQTLNVVGYDFKTLDPAQASDAETFTTFTQVYEGLVREVMKDGKVTTELAGAEKMDVSADRTVYTFHLRKDAKWSDGVPVKAQDYVFNWKRQADPKLGSDYMTFLAEIGVKGADELLDAVNKNQTSKYDELLNNLGIKAVDDSTFQVTLKAPTAYFESAIAFKGLVPAREDIAKKLGDKYGSDFSTMVYNGAFVISDYQKQSKIVFKKNDKYWDAKDISLTTINANVVTEPSTIVKMLEGKELDLVTAQMVGDDLNKLKTDAKNGMFTYTNGYDTSAYFMYLNTNNGTTMNPVMKNQKVREALSLALNRQQFLDVVYKSNIASYGIVPNGIMAGDKDYRKEVTEPLKDVKEDPKALMTAGLADCGITDPSKVTLTLLLSKASSTTKAYGDYIQKLYKDTFGINITQKFSIDSPTYFADRTKGKFDLCAGGWGADYNDVHSFFAVFLSDSNNNNGKYTNPDYDKLVKGAGMEADSAKRVAAYKQAEQMLISKDSGIIPTYYREVNSFVAPYVKGVYVQKFGGYYDLTRAYVSGK